MIRKGEFGSRHFDEQQMFLNIEQDKITDKVVVKKMNLAKPTKDIRSRIVMAASGTAEEKNNMLVLQFIDLLNACLELNPERRITPSEAFKHPFLRSDQPQV